MKIENLTENPWKNTLQDFFVFAKELNAGMVQMKLSDGNEKALGALIVIRQDADEYLAAIANVEQRLQGGSRLDDNEQTWKLRAEAMLPILQAAIALTQAEFDLKRSANRVVLPAGQYEALKIAVEEYLRSAQEEG